MTEIARVFSINIHYKKKTRKLILRKNQHETPLHIILKIVGYLLLWEKQPEIEPKFRFKKYKPDLLVRKEDDNPAEPQEEILVWMECKNVKLEKLDRLKMYLPYADILWLHKLRNLERTLIKRNVRKFKRLNKVKFLGMDINENDLRKLELSIIGILPNWNVYRNNDRFTIEFQDAIINFQIEEFEI